jgi:hypothetical protein
MLGWTFEVNICQSTVIHNLCCHIPTMLGIPSICLPWARRGRASQWTGKLCYKSCGFGLHCTNSQTFFSHFSSWRPIMEKKEENLLPSPDLRAFQNDKSHPRSFLFQFPDKHAIFFPLPFPTLQFLKCSLPTEYRAIRTFYGKPPPWLQQHDALPKKVSRHFSIDFHHQEIKRKKNTHTSFILTNS